MIKLLIDSEEFEYKKWKFPSGELGVKLENLPEKIVWLEVEWNFENNEEIFELLLLSDALERLGFTIDLLLIPYLPYSRQDRVCHNGESFSLEVLAKLLSLVNTRLIHTWDVHSEVACTKIEKLVNVDQYVMALTLPKFNVLIAPDKGASEKAKEHDQVVFEGTPVVFLTKTRKDGKVIYEDLEADTIQGEVCVVDDLADKGGTFLSLAEMLSRTQPNITRLCLYVTHAFFGAGLSEINKYYDTVYCSNLMNKELVDGRDLVII